MRVPRTLKPVPRSLRPSLLILFPLALTLALASASALPSLASAITMPSAESLPFLETLCDGDCGDLAILDSRRMDAGFAEDFSLGLQLIRDGLDLTLKSDGNILIYGGISASGTIDIRTDGTFETRGNVTLDANELRLQAGPIPDDKDLVPGIDLTLIDSIFIDCGGCLDLTVGAGDVRLTPAGSLILNSGGIELLSSAGTITAAVTGVDAIFPKPESSSGVVLYREGDIYLDASDFEFQNLKLIAGESIVFFGPDFTPVPEPGTALLLGLGLTLLGARRTSTKHRNRRLETSIQS